MKAHLAEVPQGIDGFVVQPKVGVNAKGSGGARHVPDLRLLLVAKGARVQVVDVRHVNGLRNVSSSFIMQAGSWCTCDTATCPT